MPPDTFTFDLEPGSALHVPRGFWHETNSDRDSISLHVLIDPPTWSNVLLEAMRFELLRQESMREAAYSQDIAGGKAMCDALRAVAARLDPRDIVRLPLSQSPPDEGTRFVRCGQTTFGFDASDPSSSTARVALVAHAYKASIVTRVEMSPEFVMGCEWIARLDSGRTFTIPEFIASVRELSSSEALDLMAVLEGARFVRRAGAD
jgi:50S ribosomal protein L16 3-hydroxylase